jgi:para-nitrobenzyl esterase
MSAAEVARVEIATGVLAGRRAGGVERYLGIPFAKPPIGARRFRAPEPAEPWRGVREATEFGGSAPQNELEVGVLPGMQVGRQSEDCLFVNVYTPGAGAVRRPVLVWIHGGAFTIGSGSQAIYRGDALARRGDAVVVTVNYRLGALGFLDLEARFGGEFAGAANVGLLDQIAALRWVRENIAAFGGDPDNVTIFGESAGAMSVGSLLGTPAARGLFQRAIPQSGAAHNAHDRETAARVVERYLRVFGSDDPRALREAPLERVLKAQLVTMLASDELGVLLAFQPTWGDATLPEPPIAAVRAGNAAGVTTMIGTTRDEYRLFQFLDPTLAAIDDASFAARVERHIGAAAAHALVDAYRKEWPDAGALDHYSAYETDRVFRAPAARLADAQSAHAPVYGYEFAWCSPAQKGALGACHAVELPFVFGTLDAPDMAAFSGHGPDAERLSEIVIDTWAAFARTGDPNNSAVPNWPRHDPAVRPTMIFDRTNRVDLAPRSRTLRAWEGLL